MFRVRENLANPRRLAGVILPTKRLRPREKATRARRATKEVAKVITGRRIVTGAANLGTSRRNVATRPLANLKLPKVVVSITLRSTAFSLTMKMMTLRATTTGA